MSPAKQHKHGWLIVDGDEQAPSPWLDFPQTVIGRSPFEKNRPTFFRFAKQGVQKALDEGRRQPIFDAWSMVLGKLPPIPNVSRLELRLAACPLVSILEAHACFRGVKRPVGVDDRGFDMVVMITRPKWFVRNHTSMVCMGDLSPVPEDLIFATFVRLDQPNSGRYGINIDTSAIKGVITHWQFIEADNSSGEPLPVEHRERFRKRLW